MWNHKNTWIAKRILGKKSSAGVSSSYWDVLSGHCNKNKRHADHQNKTEDQNMSSHNVSHLTKITNTYTGENEPWSPNGSGKTGFHMRRVKIDPYLSPRTKITSRNIKDLNVKPEILKLLDKKNINSTLYNIGVRKDLLNRTLFA